MRQWKAQVPFLAREFRVITVEGRGNGASDCPADPAAYRDREYVGGRGRRPRRHGHRPRPRGRTLARRTPGAAARRVAPRARERGRRDRVGPAVAAPAGVRGGPGPPRGLGEGQPALLAVRLPGLGRVLHVPGSCPSPTRPRPGRTWSGGAWRPMRRRSPTPCRGSPRPRTPRRRRCARPCAARCSSCTATRTRSPPTRTGSRSPTAPADRLVAIVGGGHAPTMREPVRTNLLIRDFARSVLGGRPVPARVDAGPVPPLPHPGRQFTDRA